MRAVRPDYCPKSGKPRGDFLGWGELAHFQSHPDGTAAYASSEPANMPLSVRCAFNVLKMCTC